MPWDIVIFGIHSQQKLISACASVLSDQSLFHQNEDSVDSKLSIGQTSKGVMRLDSFHWMHMPEDPFSHSSILLHSSQSSVLPYWSTQTWTLWIFVLFCGKGISTLVSCVPSFAVFLKYYVRRNMGYFCGMHIDWVQWCRPGLTLLICIVAPTSARCIIAGLFPGHLFFVFFYPSFCPQITLTLTFTFVHSVIVILFDKVEGWVK